MVPSGFSDSSAVELTEIPSMISSSAQTKCERITVIRFSVRVPVLSVQITVAAPIVSQAWSRRTKLFSLSILRMLRARLTVTLIGSPSGTATTISVTAIMIECSRYSTKKRGVR